VFPVVHEAERLEEQKGSVQKGIQKMRSSWAGKTGLLRKCLLGLRKKAGRRLGVSLSSAGY